MVLDTNIVIAYLNGETEVISALTDWKQNGRPLFISSITYSEVLSLPNLTHPDLDKIKSFLGAIISIPFNNYIAEGAAALRRIYGISLPDAAIAATAVINQVPLATRDQQFRKIREVTVVSI